MWSRCNWTLSVRSQGKGAQRSERVVDRKPNPLIKGRRQKRQRTDTVTAPWLRHPQAQRIGAAHGSHWIEAWSWFNQTWKKRNVCPAHERYRRVKECETVDSEWARAQRLQNEVHDRRRLEDVAEDGKEAGWAASRLLGKQLKGVDLEDAWVDDWKPKSPNYSVQGWH